MSLYKIDERIRQILATVEFAEGEIDENQIAELDQLEGDRLVKLDNILAFREEQLMRAASLKVQANRLFDLKESCEATVDRLTKYVIDSMSVAGEAKLELARFTATIPKPQPSVVVDIDPENLSSEFVNVTTRITPNKKALLEWFKSGKPLPDGVRLAYNQTLRVK